MPFKADKYENMKKYIPLLFILSFWFLNLHAQDIQVQWASKVIAVSSEDNSDSLMQQYRAKQVLGKPNKLPASGLSPCAWSPLTDSNPQGEWIKVAFDVPMPIQQVAIAENFNPGAITQIFLYDESGTEYPAIYQNLNITNIGGGRMFNIVIAPTSYNVAAIKLVLSTMKVNGVNQIDAIAISNSREPIRAEINIAETAVTDKEIKSTPENLGININSEVQEVSPVIAPDGKTIYFTRLKHPGNLGPDKKQDVWFALAETDSTFQMAQNIGSPINTIHHNSSFSITPDGNKMLLNNVYLPDGTLSKGLSITTKIDNNTWGMPKEVVINDYYNNNRYSEFCLSANGQVLLMTTERRDTYGGKDIYVSFLQGDGTWSRPKNLGNKVNTPDNETSPFLATDGLTLYYSTAGMSGYGSNDIFVTRRLDDSWENWSEPENLGASINTPNWDAYFSIPANGKYAYYSSYHNSKGDADIFRVKLSDKNKPKPVVLITGTVYNDKTKEPMGADIIYEILGTSDKVGQATANAQTGTYKIVLPIEKLYSIHAEAKGFFPIDDNIDLTNITEYTEIKKDLYLAPIIRGESFRLNNIFFVRAKAELLPESFPELHRLAITMKENSTMIIELHGHTEPFGDAKELKRLSEDRVIAVKNYLVGEGVESIRISYKAFGGSKPISTEKTEEARALNRRVEVKILHQ
ncbi:MAG: flagellar motor protein MotB [Cytophagales bacterium]|nr:MAG: flagellar motor protein MotB [Cytophagales bacterium]